MKWNHPVRLSACILMLSMAVTSCTAGTATSPTAQISDAATAATSQASTGPAIKTTAPTEPIRYTNSQKYSVKYTATISNTGFSPSDIKLYLPLPTEHAAQRDLVVREISPKPDSQTAETTSGNAMLYWYLQGTPKENTSASFTLSFDVTAYETNTAIDPAAVKPYSKDNREVQLYTKPETYIESDDPKIISLADSLAKEETNPYLMAKAFYDYIIDTMEYKILGQGLNGSKYLLDNKQGECGDYSALFVALCRAKGIPANPIVGYWAISGNDQTHVWAEFFLEGFGWIPVDATIGQQSAEKRSYYFGNMDNRRIILSKGYNTPLVPEAPDSFSTPLLQVPLWWFWGSGDTKKLSLARDWAVGEVQ